MTDLFNAAPFTPFKLPDGNGYRAAWDTALQGWEIAVPDGLLTFVPAFFDERVSNRSLEYFQENDSFDWRKVNFKKFSSVDLGSVRFKNICWKQDHISLYGKVHPLPRLTAWYGDEGKAYTYSGITSIPNAWNKGLLYLKERVESCARAEFNSVLLNWYRDGSDHLSWHSDDEKELGEQPIVASVNFGATRDFVLRRKSEPTAKITMPLSHGSLLIMRGQLQKYWEHSVPKRAKVDRSRFNLTFRKIGLH